MREWEKWTALPDDLLEEAGGGSGVSYIEYVVRHGDTLESIAQRHHSTVAQLTALNQLTSQRLSIGQMIKIPVYMG